MINTKTTIFLFVLSLSLVLIGCDKKDSTSEIIKGSNPENVMFDFFEENFILGNYDNAQKLTEGISRKKNISESKKTIDYVDKSKAISLYYREISKDSNSQQKNYQLFIDDFHETIDITLKENNGEWKVTSYKTKFYEDPEKMVDLMNSYKWKDKDIYDEDIYKKD